MTSGGIAVRGSIRPPHAPFHRDHAVANGVIASPRYSTKPLQLRGFRALEVKHGIRRGEWKLSVAEVAGQEGKLNVWSLEIEPA